MQQPSITFIICTYNRAAYLRDAMLSLLKTEVQASEFKILVVDNNSTDSTASIIEQIVQQNTGFDIKYVKEISQGLTYARNRGIREANTPYIVFLDDDIIATESLISAWLSFFKKHPNTVAAGGKIHVEFDDTEPEWMSYYLLPLFGRHDFGNHLKTYPGQKSPFGGNMGFDISIFDKVGYFNTDIGKKADKLTAKGEEKEVFQRIRDLSIAIYYLPDAFVYHRVDGSRLTLEYVKQQALGIGRGMRLRLNQASVGKKITEWSVEFFKFLASILLSIGYLFSGKPAKAKMLFQFRWWIWEGFFKKH